ATPGSARSTSFGNGGTSTIPPRRRVRTDRRKTCRSRGFDNGPLFDSAARMAGARTASIRNVDEAVLSDSVKLGRVRDDGRDREGLPLAPRVDDRSSRTLWHGKEAGMETSVPGISATPKSVD